MPRVDAATCVGLVVSCVLLSASAVDGQVVETGWENTAAEGAATFTSAEVVANNAPAKAALAASTANAAAAAAYENYMVCWTVTGPVFYVSDIFDAGPPPPGPRGRQENAIGQLFGAFLQKKYALTANAHAICGRPSNPTLQAAQAYKQQQEERAKQANRQIVETGWKHE